MLTSLRFTSVTRAGAIVALALTAACRVDAPVARRSTLPDSLDNRQFWATIERFSEPGGYFRSENLLSNERQFQHVIPRLTSATSPGGVYIGVGPEQNFTYIGALQPKIAIIVDIRRQNMILHLWYKALFEISQDRAEFVSRLFARPRPPGLDTSTATDSMFALYESLPPDSAYFEASFHDVQRQLTRVRGLPLDTADLAALRHVAEAFYLGGPDIDYNFPRYRAGGFFARGRMPTYLELMIATDAEGVNRGFLGNEPNFRRIKTLHTRNLIIPVVGDFGGPKALRSIAGYLKEHDATVTAVYTSNVEQYLFQSGDAWRRYYENVRTLPLDESSTFIRSIRPGLTERRPPPSAPVLTSTLSPMVRFLDAYRRGKVNSYYDVADLSR
jgi:hypothetical protein